MLTLTIIVIVVAIAICGAVYLVGRMNLDKKAPLMWSGAPSFSDATWNPIGNPFQAVQEQLSPTLMCETRHNQLLAWVSIFGPQGEKMLRYGHGFERWLNASSGFYCITTSVLSAIELERMVKARKVSRCQVNAEVATAWIWRLWLATRLRFFARMVEDPLIDWGQELYVTLNADNGVKVAMSIKWQIALTASKLYAIYSHYGDRRALHWHGNLKHLHLNFEHFDASERQTYEHQLARLIQITGLEREFFVKG